MAINLKPVDVAVIGLGAAGGVAVLPLARAGLKVAGLEAGTWMDPKTFRPDELRNNVRGLLTSVPKANREVPTVRDSESSPSRRAQIHPMMNAVGGTSIHYWAQSWRLNPWDFKARSEAAKRYGPTAIPARSTLEDWPLGYDDLEPYYDIVEHEVGVSGKAGNLQGKLDPAGNVHEGPRQREYPMPPLRGSGFTDHMAEVARQLGWKPFRPPAAINSQEYGGRPGCAFHGYCNRGGCHISAKNSTAVTTIPAALKTKNLTVFDRAHVTRIVAGADGGVTGVTYLREGKEYFQPARVVLLASYTYENSRLLLLSKSKAYPQGLANNHRQVGRHYFGHWQSGVTAVFPYDINVWYGTPAQASAVDDWADDNYDHSGLGFIGGSTLQPHTEMHPIEAASMNTTPMDSSGRAPGWGSRWKAFVRENAARWTAAYLQTSAFPYEDIFLDLDPAVRDPLGDPVCRITNGFKENEARAAEFGQKKMEEWFRAAGAIQILRAPASPPGATTHAYGGTRMGDNPETNVVDRWGFSHEARNLGVLGASVMGVSGARNPTLTVQALSWRTAEHLAKNWNAISS
ncbi:MAG TPA: GMC family oxidoreductase [Bryobacteraceae bacterium]|nr:GMC family oxidoreductase [Bryobacteraceae bacterium]